jgi:aspartate/methionine/tyrosine aminotransferase
MYMARDISWWWIKTEAMSDYQPFLMERFMSAYEQEVDYNLSESGVHPMTLRELLSIDHSTFDELLETEINYPHVNGIPELRDHIASLYEGAGRENVLVTVGAIEANYNSLRTLMNPGDEMVTMLPNYMQIWGVAKNHGYKIKTFQLNEEKSWAPDLAELDDKVTENTRLIAVCNPNNPTGYILKEWEMEEVVRIAGRVGAWIMADEVYAGAEQFTDQQTPSFYGKYDRVIAVGSMSKAYGLPGLRTGWLVAPQKMVDQVWARHEYTTISTTMLSNKLTALALSENVRPTIINRTRSYIRKGYPVLKEWMDQQGDTFRSIAPQAAAIAFIKYKLDINSTELAMRLIREKGVMVVPGDHFGMDKYLRISYGLPEDYLKAALHRIEELIRTL